MRQWAPVLVLSSDVPEKQEVTSECGLVLKAASFITSSHIFAVFVAFDKQLAAL